MPDAHTLVRHAQDLATWQVRLVGRERLALAADLPCPQGEDEKTWQANCQHLKTLLNK